MVWWNIEKDRMKAWEFVNEEPEGMTESDNKFKKEAWKTVGWEK